MGVEFPDAEDHLRGSVIASSLNKSSTLQSREAMDQLPRQTDSTCLDRESALPWRRTSDFLSHEHNQMRGSNQGSCFRIQANN